MLVLCCAVGALLVALTGAKGPLGGLDLVGDDASAVDGHGSTGSTDDGDGNPYQDTVPCTGPHQPVNFEVFSAGPKPAGLSLTGTSRRCDTGAPRWGWPNNYVNYSYGSCKIPKGATGCSPPLTIQTWPACQRAMSDYSLEGRPLPHKSLPPLGDARVVDFTFPAERIEVYTKSATIVIFANDPELARKALRLLRPQEAGTPPAMNADDLEEKPVKALEPPSEGSMEGDLSCQS